MTDRIETPTFPTYTPLVEGKAAPEEDSGRLQDLYLCAETAQFFTVVDMHVEVDRRSSRSAKQFFCPCCPKSVLSIGTENGETSIKCPMCHWDARRTGVTTVSELLQRDADPFPWISEEIRRLTRHLNTQNGARNDVYLADDFNASTETGTPRTKSMHRIQRMRKSMMHIERRPKEEELSKAESAAQAAQNFAHEQEKKERRIFSSWLPSDSAPSTSPSTRKHPGRPSGDISSLSGELGLDDLVPMEQRVCSTTWLRRDCAAQRRVPPPRIIVRSPFGKQGVARAAEGVVPPVRITIEGKCDDEAALRVYVENPFAFGEMRVCVSNAAEKSQSGETRVRQNETGEVGLGPFKLVESDPCVTFQYDPPCARVASVNVTVVYTDGEFAGQAFHLRMYVRHAGHAR